MLRYVAFLLGALMFSANTAQPDASKPYEDPEAYAVYSALLSPNSDKQAVMAQRTLVFENCYQPDDKWREELGPVVENYKKINQDRWDLVDANIRFPHKLISAEEMRMFFSKGAKAGWKKFNRKYPDKALLLVSAVGFNSDKTVAMVATESDCGPLCGSGGMSFLRKVDGVWRKFYPSGTICTVSH